MTGLDSKSNCSSEKVLPDGCHQRCTRQCDLLIRACYLRFDHLQDLAVRGRCILRGRCTARRQTPTPGALPRSWRRPAAKQVALHHLPERCRRFLPRRAIGGPAGCRSSIWILSCVPWSSATQRDHNQQDGEPAAVCRVGKPGTTTVVDNHHPDQKKR